MKARKLLLATFVTALFTTAAEARPRPEGHLGGRSFEANKTFGLGLELGAPFGLNGKWFFSPNSAIDFGIGDNYSYYSRSGLHIYGDFLFHPTSLASNPAFELPFYFGVGVRFWDFRDNSPRIAYDATAVGIRVPLGLSFDFNNIPLDAFIQIVPTLDFYSGYAPHSIFIDFDFSVGARYWFN